MQFDSPQVGYPVAIGIMAAVGIIFHLICYFGVKEHEVVVKKKNRDSY